KAFVQEKNSQKEKFLETLKLRRTRGVIKSGGLIGPANSDFGPDASRRGGCICEWRPGRGVNEQGWRRCRSRSDEILQTTRSMHRVRRERTQRRGRIIRRA